MDIFLDPYAHIVVALFILRKERSSHYFVPTAVKVLNNNTWKWDLFIWTPLFFVLHFTSQKTLVDLKYFFKKHLFCPLKMLSWKAMKTECSSSSLLISLFIPLLINTCVLIIVFLYLNMFNFFNFTFGKIHSFKVYFVWWISCQNCCCICRFLYRWLLNPFIIAFKVSFKRTLAIVYLIIFFSLPLSFLFYYL